MRFDRFPRGARLAAALMLGAALMACGGGSGGGSGGGGQTPVTGIAASGTSSLDTTNSQAATGGATQTGTLLLVSASSTATATFADDPTAITPGASVAGQVLNVGDGVGARFSMSGSSGGAPADSDGVHADFWFDLQNPSGTETLRVTFRAAVSNTVTATGGDAYAFSSLSVRDASTVELYFSERRIDTLNPVNDLTAESPSAVFSIVLAPGQTTRISGVQSQRGGVVGVGGYGAALDTFISLESVAPA